jgi:CheY-like chemotaxis protein/HPt (histidine-containing phosphotransfer) domain-containing protein
LRALVRALDAGSAVEPPPRPPSPRPVSIRPLRILLAEDNPMNQKLAVRLLQKHGHSVTVAGTGREALDALFGAGPPFDVVLMDVQMPDMDGLEAAAAIRDREKTTGRHVPVIAMTAHAMKGDEDRCLTAGMDAYIAKPIKPDALFAALERFVPDPGRKQRIDWAKALSHARGDTDLLRELTGIFLEELPKWRSAVRDGLAKSDAELVCRTAHTLKGSLGMLAAADACDAAQALETIAHNGLSAEAPAAFERLDAELEELVPPLARFAHGEPPS